MEKQWIQLISNFKDGAMEDILKRSEDFDVYDNKKSPGDYISAHIRSKREKLLRFAKTLRSGNMYYWRNFQRLLSLIYIDLNIKFEGRSYKHDSYLTYFVLEPKLFLSLREHYDEIILGLEQDDRNEFIYTLKRFEQCEQKVQEKVTEIRRWLDPIIKEALEYAFNKIDITRNIQEIVKYANCLFDTRYADLLLQHQGLTRLRRNSGNRVVKKHFHENPVYAVIESEMTVAELKLKLTKGQFEFLKKSISIVKKDMELNNISEYSCDFYGAAILQRKYLSQKLGESPENIRKRISRIKKRIK